MTNANKIRGRIIEQGYTFGSFSQAMGKSRPSINKKIRGDTEWTVAEIERACMLLKIDKDEITDYFFID